MEKILTAFKGRLTYTMAAVAIAAGVAGYFTGHLDKVESLQFVWAGFTVFGVRRSIDGKPLGA
jgi:type IV secretory pathway VirB2 component (pilin)